MEVDNRSLAADIAVIGGGATGLAAAVAAAELGAKVVLLEKRRILGGNSNMAEGFFASESPAQKRMRIDAPNDVFFKIAMDYAHYRINPRVVRAFINKSGDTVRWLEEKGLYFDWIPHFIPNQSPRVWHCMRGYGAELTKVLAKECERLGVSILTKTRAEHVVVDGRGRMTGVQASTKNGDVTVNTKCVVVGTGGFGANKRLLAKHCQDYSPNMIHIGVREVTGDGLRIAQEMGAASEGLGHLQVVGPSFVKHDWQMEAVVGEPSTIWVNSRGERFVDESLTFNEFETGNAVLRQPERLCYCLFDSVVKRGMIEEGLAKGVGVLDCPPGSRLEGLDAKLAHYEQMGVVKSGRSWTHIAQWIGIEESLLQGSVNEYNAACASRHDDTFAKDPRYLVALAEPPYYGVKCSASFLGTIGGIKISEKMEVLDQNDAPIPGLYAGGADTGGWESETYCVRLPGTTYGFALNSGRIAGENAAHFVGK